MNVKFSKLVVFGAAFAVSAALTGTAHAGSFTGQAYCDIQTDSGGNGSNFAVQTPTTAQLSTAETTAASGAACASFASTGINYATGADSTSAVAPGVTGGVSLNNFLNYSGSLTSSAYTASTASANGAPPIQANGAQNDNGTLIVLTGSTFLTGGVSSITFSHDDGALLYICPTAEDCTLTAGDIPADPTSLADYTLISPAGSGTQTIAGQPPFTFTGATGSYTFLLIYNSNYTQPSELVSNINTFAPPAITPEPNSLMLLGTGLFSAAGMFFRKRQTV